MWRNDENEWVFKNLFYHCCLGNEVKQSLPLSFANVWFFHWKEYSLSKNIILSTYMFSYIINLFILPYNYITIYFALYLNTFMKAIKNDDCSSKWFSFPFVEECWWFLLGLLSMRLLPQNQYFFKVLFWFTYHWIVTHRLCFVTNEQERDNMPIPNWLYWELVWQIGQV